MASGSLATRSVDIAVLCNDISRPVVLDDSVTVIDLAPICPPLSISNFMKMFYKNGPGSKFSMLNDTDALTATSQIGDGAYSSVAQRDYAVSETGLTAIPLNDYVSFSCQTIEGAGGNNSAFDLKKAILGAYSSNESGVGVDSNCWAPCSLIAICDQINKLKHLYDICNVECSRTFYEAMQEVSSLFSGDPGTSVINTRVSVVFTNQNPVVQDVIVRFNFLVELLCLTAKPLIDTPLSSLYDGIDNVPVFRGGELIGSQPLKSSFKCGNPTAAEMVKGSDSLAYFFNKSIVLVGQRDDCPGPSEDCWCLVTESDCLPPCFPFDVSTNQVYVLSVVEKKKVQAGEVGKDPEDGRVTAPDFEPLPVLLWDKLRNGGAQQTAAACNVDTLVVVNVYLNLACGKSAEYFPGVKKGHPFPASYQGIDPADIFFGVRGGISVSNPNKNAYATSKAAAEDLHLPDVVGSNTNAYNLTGATLLEDQPPACVGDLYLLGTQANLFMQHATECTSDKVEKSSVDPITGIIVNEKKKEGKTPLWTALQLALGPQIEATLDDTPDKQGWGLEKANEDKIKDGCFKWKDHQRAFTKAELACKPFAVVITDVCALPSK